MKNTIYIGNAAGLLATAVAFIAQNIFLFGVAFAATLYFVICLFDKAKVQYSRRHYRRYNPIFVWRKGPWKPILHVTKITVIEYSPYYLYRLLSGMRYQACFMNGYGYDKLFESRTLEEARLRAQKMAKKFKLPVEVKFAPGEKEINRKRLTLG